VQVLDSINKELRRGRYKKLDVRNVIQYSIEECLVSVTRGP